MDYKYKVIEIMNAKELIVNYGSKKGAKVGEKVRIYSIGEDVKDPESHEVIGTLDIIKDELEIYVVYNNFSICRKIIRSSYNPVLNPLANLNKTETKSLNLNVKQSEITGRELPKKAPFIQVGDKVEILK